VRRLRGSRRATVPAMEFERPDGNTDWTIVGLASFFASLIVLVGALLLFPAVL
jgi:hypothetical protein